MNSFLFSAIALCLAAQGALAGYQQQQQAGYGASNGYNQRKMAPSPQTYGNSNGGGYGAQEQSYGGAVESGAYDNQQAAGYGAGQASAGYGKQAQSYARPAAVAAASYGQQSAGYAKAAPRYEEPSYPPMPFAWGYDINDGYGGAQYHKESGDEYGKRTGSYGYTDAYGVYRQVDYVADEHGFRATIKTNEPGTANESPADVELHAYEPPSNYYAGNKESYGKQSYGSGSSYGSQGSSSYGAGQSAGYGQQQTSSYSAAAAAPVAASYGRQQASSGYSAPQQSAGYGASQSSYGSAAAPARSSAYSSKSASSAYSAPRQSYAATEQSYSGSSLVPVYQKAAPAKIAPSVKVAAKRH